jgi:hypothetical protein
MKYAPTIVVLPGCVDQVTTKPIEVWMTDVEAGEVLAYDGRDGGLLRVVADRASVGDERFAPSALAALGSGWAVADFASGDVQIHDGARGRTYHNGPSSVRLEEPCSLLVEGERLLALGNDTRNVVALGPEARDREEVVDDPIRSGHALDALGEDTLVVGTSPGLVGMGLVQLRDRWTGELRADFGGPPELEEATDVVVVDGGIFVVDWFTGQVVAYESDGAWVGVIAAGLDRPIAAVPGPGGELWVLTSGGIVTVGPRGVTQRVPADERWQWPRDLMLGPPAG